VGVKLLACGKSAAAPEAFAELFTSASQATHAV